MASYYNLGKDEEYSLAKNDEELSRIKVYLHWLAKPGDDLDASAFILGDDGIVIDHDGFVYYNSTTRIELPKDNSKDADYYFTHYYFGEPTPFNREKFGTKRGWRELTRPMSTDGAVLGSYDDKGDGDEDDSEKWNESDETININLEKVNPNVYEIVICITMHPNPEKPNSTFKDIREPYVEIVNDETDEVLCRYELGENFSKETAAEVGKFVCGNDGEWKFKAIGKGYEGGLQTFVDIYTD